MEQPEHVEREHKLSVLIVAAGSSRRMGFDKLEAPLGGRTVLEQTLLAFEACEEVRDILVVTGRDKWESLHDSARRWGILKFAGAVEGGRERFESVLAGLRHIAGFGAEWVAVHDGARPLLTPEAVRRCFAAARESGGATLAHRVADTLKRGDGQNQVAGSVSRENLWAMETPQMFRLARLVEGYEKVLADGVIVPTDETSVFEAVGWPVTLVENPDANLKITVPADLLVAEAILQARQRQQAG